MWQLRVSRSRCNGSETCADGLLCAAAAPARAHERLRRVAQDAVQHQRARMVVPIVVKHVQRLPKSAH